MRSCFQSNLHCSKISSNARKCYRILVQWKSFLHLHIKHMRDVRRDLESYYVLKSLSQQRFSFNYVCLKA